MISPFLRGVPEGGGVNVLIFKFRVSGSGMSLRICPESFRDLEFKF